MINIKINRKLILSRPNDQLKSRLSDNTLSASTLKSQNATGPAAGNIRRPLLSQIGRLFSRVFREELEKEVI
nr:hypothetical protein [candidate division Zixibacteria bacterium]